jgi:hypothetical protein
MAKKYKGSFTIREVNDKPRGRKTSNSRAIVALLLFLFIAWFVYSRSHRVATYVPQRANNTR